MIPAERIVQFDSRTPDSIRPGWTLEVSPRAVTALFPPSYWTRQNRIAEDEITGFCEAVARCLREVVANAQKEIA